MPEESTDIPDGVKSKLNVRLMYLTEEQSHLILDMFLPTGETGEEWDGEIEKVLKWADDVMLAGNTLQMIMERKVHVKWDDGSPAFLLSAETREATESFLKNKGGIQ